MGEGFEQDDAAFVQKDAQAFGGEDFVFYNDGTWHGSLPLVYRIIQRPQS